MSWIRPTADITPQSCDWVRTGTNLGVQRIRVAAADFKPGSADPQTPTLKSTFDTTLFNDLNNSGVLDMVSKSMAPPATPGSPQEINLAQWSAAPSNARCERTSRVVAAGQVWVDRSAAGASASCCR